MRLAPVKWIPQTPLMQAKLSLQSPVFLDVTQEPDNMFKVFASMQFARSHPLQWLPMNPASSSFRVKPLALPHRRAYISRVQKDALGTIEARLPVDNP
jgi:hypothetical protein